MTSFKTKSFEFFTFDKSNPNHICALKEFRSDKLSNRYLRYLGETLSEDNLSNVLDNAYLVGNGKEVIGYINLINCGAIEDIHYAILPNFRGIRDNSLETLGAKMTKELSDMLLSSYKGIQCLRLVIDKTNFRSIRLAESIGYKRVDQYGDMLEYRKYPNFYGSNFTTESFNFLVFDKNDKRHLELLETIHSDLFGSSFIEMLDDIKVYLVSSNGTLIGYISLYDENKIQEIYCRLKDNVNFIVDGDRTVGSQILLESTDELFLRCSYIETFRTFIEKRNINSINDAINAGFKLYNGRSSEYLEYRKDLSRKVM